MKVAKVCVVFFAFLVIVCLQTGAIAAADTVPVAAATGTTVAGMTIADCRHDLESENRIVRLRAIRTLGVFDAEAAEPLASALDHKDPAVRFLAATHLGRIGGASLTAAVDRLKSLATAPQEDVAGESSDDEHAQPLGVKMAAAYALCESGQTDRFLPILIDALSYPERGAACYAADLIGRLGADAVAATDALENAYRDNKPGVKGGDYHLGGAAMNALRKIRGQ